MGIKSLNLVVIAVLASVLTSIESFNVDIGNPIIYSELPNTSFGFSVALSKSNNRNLLFVGAPTANSSHDSTSVQPGVIFACSIGNSLCREIDLNYNQGNEIFGRNFDYEQLRNNGWLGVSLDVSPDESQFVACGHLWKDQKYRGDYLTNGICYVSNTNLGLKGIRRLLPLVQLNKQVIARRYIYALGLAGMSAHYVEDNSTLLIGAPGVFQLSGTVIGVPNYKRLISTTSSLPRPDYFIPIPNAERNEDSYFGYAVTSGKFFSDKQIYYAAGAPRQGVYGMVYIYLLSAEDPNSELQIRTSVEGKQMGEYFGASLCAVDVNNDGFADLIVGAPLYSSDLEEGRIYVYMSDGTHLRIVGQDFVGTAAFRARFGTAIASIGDINLDGYQDIAVGAPYDNSGNGAVYIYHGSAIGLKHNAAQKIMAADVSPKLKGFGMSVSRGKDIDDNFYPDIAVGASVSANAVVLRSKPIVRLSGSINFDTNHINTDVKNCSENGKPVTCFLMSVCVSYDGAHAPDSIDLDVYIESDVLLKDKFQPPRVHYFDGGLIRNNLNFTKTLSKNKATCMSYPVHAKAGLVDFLTPVQFDMSFKLKQPVTAEFCKTCPAIDLSAPVNVTKQLSFFTGCGEDDKCISDLHLTAKIAQYEIGREMVLGSESNLQLLVDVSNSQDPAFQAMLHVVFPPNVDYSRIPSECSSYSKDAQLALACNLGNPLEAGPTVSLSIGVDLQKLTASTKELAFNISVTTASEEDEVNLIDNFMLLVLPVRLAAGIDVTGWQMFEQQFVYNRSNPGVAPITHMYQIVKTEPSPVQTVEVELKFPVFTSNKLTFLQNFTLEVFYNYKPVPVNLCSSRVDDPTDAANVRHVEIEHGTATIADCGNMMCHVVKCTLGPFIKREIVTVNVGATVDLAALIHAMGNADIIQLRSSAYAVITDVNLVRAASTISDSTEVSTTFLPQDLVPQPGQIAVWIIILAIIGGILVLAAIIAVFYKFGFFKRKEHERLLEATKESADNDEYRANGESETLHSRTDSPDP